MPTYAYVCTDCGTPLEVQQSFTDDALTECPTCAGRLRKVFSAVGVVFKGSGFYRNDSRAPVKTAESGSDGAGTSGDGKVGSKGGSKDGAGKGTGGDSSGRDASAGDSSGAGSKSTGSGAKRSGAKGSGARSSTGSAA